MQIEVRQLDALSYEGDALLLPICGEGTLDQGLAARIKAVVGEAIEQQVIAHAPIAVGAAYVTPAGPLKVSRLIHAPVIEAPGQRIGVENIRRAMRAGLLAATHHELARVAVPGFGYGELGVPEDEAARAMVDEIRGYKKMAKPHPVAVTLVDTHPEMVAALKQYVGSH